MSRKQRRAHLQPVGVGKLDPLARKPRDPFMCDLPCPDPVKCRREGCTNVKAGKVSPPLSELAQRFGNDAVDTGQGFWDTPPKLTDADAAFGVRNWRQYLPPWTALTKDEQQGRGPWCEAVSNLFFNGGKLVDHGITIKPDINRTDVHRYMRAMLQDFGPPHEHKIGGIAHMLKKWCIYKKG